MKNKDKDGCPSMVRKLQVCWVVTAECVLEGLNWTWRWEIFRYKDRNEGSFARLF